uniref:Acetate kinase n=1 Tax=uncultured Alphaproteobacteria bacterium TaxID=91750 RepID=A0A6G8F1Z2_9PROT|nr:acetate kinase [uncultured Alphaproteobacteria bacterium]
MDKILVLNSGSSSLKYQLFNVEGDNYEVVAKGLAERIGIDGSFVSIKIGDGEKIVKEVALPTHQEAIKEVFALLLNGVLKSMDELSGVGHRVVHGGEYFDRSVLVTDEVVDRIAELCTLAPLHNPAALLGIKAIKSLLPNIPQVVAFDTAFHQTMKPEAYMYALPKEQYKNYKIRRYGAHGTSHLFVSREAAKLIGKAGKIITCHIGNGASISAVKDGECIDTSMGFTPLAGVVMGTRSGDVDPFVPLYIMKTQNKTVEEVDNLLNKQSGMFGLCGFSDNRDVEAKYFAGDKDAITAMQVYTYSIVKYIGAYTAAMGGVDAIVFTGGVGENGSEVRKLICERLAFMGIELDEEANSKRGQTIEISKAGSKVRVFVIPTNEELVIAQDTKKLI